MATTRMTRFETSAGCCTLLWTPDALVSLELPQEWSQHPPHFEVGPRLEDPEATLPEFVREAIRRVRAHLAGQVPTYDDLPVELSPFSAFTRSVLVSVRRIPPGETRTYRDVAREVGHPRAARAVGRALQANPLPLIIPCHRVVAASGGLGGFSAPGGVETKRRLLAREGRNFP